MKGLCVWRTYWGLEEQAGRGKDHQPSSAPSQGAPPPAECSHGPLCCFMAQEPLVVGAKTPLGYPGIGEESP